MICQSASVILRTQVRMLSLLALISTLPLGPTRSLLLVTVATEVQT